MPPTEKLDTHQKALALDLDPSKFGSFAEIAAGQEVARWFLAVGAASGTVAKTISAYDKQVSDDLYGSGVRYVSSERLEAMLDSEWNQLLKHAITTFVNRYTREPVRFAVGLSLLIRAFEDRYKKLSSSIRRRPSAICTPMSWLAISLSQCKFPQRCEPLAFEVEHFSLSVRFSNGRFRRPGQRWPSSFFSPCLPIALLG